MNDILSLLAINNNTNDLLLFVGIGNRLKSDDAVGIHICENLQPSERKQVLIVESGIEKYVGKINSIAPSLLILVDSTDFNKEPGFCRIFPVKEIPDNTFHTHTISLGRISEFFEMKTYILGIQPEYVGFGEEISPKVARKAEELISLLNKKI
jgi:hydrogenase maturation protease